MKKTFVEKSNFLTFLGIATAMSVVALLLLNCSKKEEKTVKISPKIPNTKVVKSKSNKRVIYLTLDDGPNKGTENFLKIIHERNIYATAFVVGKHVFGSKKQTENFKILENDTLVEVGNHSFSHANNQYSNFYKNPELVLQDFDLAKDSLHLKDKICRTPGRNIWRLNHISETDLKSSISAADYLSKSNYKIVGWDLEWKPTKNMTLKGTHQQMLKRVDSIFFNDLEKTPRHLVLLTHDQYLTNENSVKELSLFLKKLQKTNRFEFKKISEYPEIIQTLN